MVQVFYPRNFFDRVDDCKFQSRIFSVLGDACYTDFQGEDKVVMVIAVT